MTQVAPHNRYRSASELPDVTRRVWSLWGLMNVFRAHQIAADLKAVLYWHDLYDYMRSQGRGHDKPGDEVYGSTVKDVTALRDCCAQSGFLQAAQRIGLILQRIELEKDRSDVSYLAAELRNIWDAILEVLVQKRFLTVRAVRAACIDNPNLLGPEVTKAFPDARFDIMEAGNCFAAECHTAAVFHLMRAFEHGIRSFAADLGLKRFKDWSKQDQRFKYTPASFVVWEKFINQIPGKIEGKLRQWSPGARRQRRQEYYYSVHDDIKTVKEAWRNHVMHSRREFNSPEAEAVFGRVKDMLSRMAKKP